MGGTGRLQFVGLVIAALVLARIPLVNIPFDWFETFFHEISHGLAALATGGHIVRIELHLDGSGLCYTAGGWRLPVLFAGYAGAVVWGALLYIAVASASRGTTQLLVGMLGALVAVSAVLWARDLITLIILGAILALVALAWRADRLGLSSVAVRFIGVYVMLSAARAPLHLIDGRNLGDGYNLANLTYLPEILWVVVWEVLAVGGLWVVFRWRAAGAPDAPRSRTPA